MNSGRDMMYAHRLNRDISELFSHDFCCSSSNLSVTYREDADDYCDSIESYGAYLILCVEIYEGPYRGGCYLFELRIPHGYPFKIVDVYSKQPIWHPNIELQTGRVALPIDWSPVLTLNSLAVAVQMIMLEPSSDSPLNLESFSNYISNTESFDHNVQSLLCGKCSINGINFHSPMLLSQDQQRVARKQRSGNYKHSNACGTGHSHSLASESMEADDDSSYSSSSPPSSTIFSRQYDARYPFHTNNSTAATTTLPLGLSSGSHHGSSAFCGTSTDVQPTPSSSRKRPYTGTGTNQCEVAMEQSPDQDDILGSGSGSCVNDARSSNTRPRIETRGGQRNRHEERDGVGQRGGFLGHSHGYALDDNNTNINTQQLHQYCSSSGSNSTSMSSVQSHNSNTFVRDGFHRNQQQPWVGSSSSGGSGSGGSGGNTGGDGHLPQSFSRAGTSVTSITSNINNGAPCHHHQNQNHTGHDPFDTNRQHIHSSNPNHSHNYSVHVVNSSSLRPGHEAKSGVGGGGNTNTANLSVNHINNSDNQERIQQGRPYLVQDHSRSSISGSGDSSNGASGSSGAVHSGFSRSSGAFGSSPLMSTVYEQLSGLGISP